MKMMLLVLLLAAGLVQGRGVNIAQDNSIVVPMPDGSYYFRVQALSSTLVRVERSTGAAQIFEDRLTFSVRNRTWPGLQVRTSGNAHNVTLTTTSYAVRFEFESSFSLPGDSCAMQAAGQDAVCANACVASRTTKYPNGVKALSAAECCSFCNADPECKYWVWESDGGQFCFPLRAAVGTKPVAGRVFGGNGAPPPNPTPTPTPSPPGQGDRLTILSVNGTVLWQSTLDLSKVPYEPSMPDPASVPAVWAMRDAPRFVPPSWGATPPPTDPLRPLGPLANTSGFDFRGSHVPDVYFFLTGQSNGRTAGGVGMGADAYATLRRDVLSLTGAIPALPDYAYGLWFTWYHNYSQAEKQAEVEHFQSLGLPLDVISLDMDWRNHPCYPYSMTPNCSAYGPMDEKMYEPNDMLFPDYTGFFDWAHARNLSVFFNDHPMVPDVEHYETSPAEISFRWAGLTKMMDMGLDFWWFDCHWHDLIPGVGCPSGPVGASSRGPVQEGCAVDYAAWGQYVFTSIMSRYNHEKRPGVRTMMLGCSSSSHPANHRTPVWWTGDNQYDALAQAVQQMVDGGVQLKPYVHPDCAGHHGPGIGDGRTPQHPAAEYPGEVFARWIQFCATGTVFRLHSDPALGRQPWNYGEMALNISRIYMRMRKQLLPTLVSAGARAHTEGVPIVRRCDLDWPGDAPKPASIADPAKSLLHGQYMLGDDLLVAPVDPFRGKSALGSNGTYAPPFNRETSVWVPPGEWEHTQTGETVRGPTILNVTSSIDQMPMYHRRGGGVLVLASKTAQAMDEWRNLTLEIFPSFASASSSTRVFVDSKEQASIVRRTRTDLGLNAASIEAECHTRIGLQEDANGVATLSIDAPRDLRCQSHLNREWVVRFHLKRGQHLVSLTPSDIHVTATTAVFLPIHGDKSSPSTNTAEVLAGCGAGQRPATSAGPVVEIRVRQGSSARSHIELRSTSISERAARV